MASSSLDFGSTLSQPLLALPRSSMTHLRTWLPVFVCLAVFAFESTSWLGGEHTSAPLRRVAEAFCGTFSNAQWFLLHHLIRKVGHFVGCGLFALICFRTLWRVSRSASSSLSRQLRAHAGAILATFLLAGADEIHQCFVPNRYGRVSDVLLDTCGALATCLMLFMVMQALSWRAQQAGRNSSSRQAAGLGAFPTLG